jgi:hypothetical protein
MLHWCRCAVFGYVLLSMLLPPPPPQACSTNLQCIIAGLLLKRQDVLFYI